MKHKIAISCGVPLNQLEAEKMRQLLRNCALELREMEMMVAYRKDEGHVAHVKFYSRHTHKPKE